MRGGVISFIRTVLVYFAPVQVVSPRTGWPIGWHSPLSIRQTAQQSSANHLHRRNHSQLFRFNPVSPIRIHKTICIPGRSKIIIKCPDSP